MSGDGGGGTRLMVSPNSSEQRAAEAELQPPSSERESEPHLWSALRGTDHHASSRAWLALQCRSLPGTEAGLLLLQQDGRFVPVATWPKSGQHDPELERVAQRALEERREVVFWTKLGTNAQPASGIIIGVPILAQGMALGVAAFKVFPEGNGRLAAILNQLHWGLGRLETLLVRQHETEAVAVARRTATAFDILAVAGEQRRFEAAALAIVNELATRLSCDRVSLGVRRRRGVRLISMSHSSWFQRKAQLVEAIENAMEEALDQNAAVALPAAISGERCISLSHRVLAKIAGAPALISVVIPGRRGLFGAITLERHSDVPFGSDAFALCKLVGVVVGSTLEAKADAGRWIAGRAVNAIGHGFNVLLGPRRPGMKLGAIAIVALVAALAVAEGQHRVSAKSVLEGAMQRASVAPFDGFIAQASARAGDTVHQGDILAILDDKDLVLNRAKWRGELDKVLQKQREALSKHDRLSLGVLTAQRKQAESELALIDRKLSRIRIQAPFDGLIISGDLSQMLGSPVEKGKVLFETAPLQAFRVILRIDERDIGHVQVGQSGSLTLTGAPHRPLPLAIPKTTPVSTAEDGKNVFRVEAELGESGTPLRPGMEGIAKIEIGRRSLVWIWGHPVIDWVRLTTWKWLP